MPLICVRDDLTRIEADVIVNSANPAVQHGDGGDRAVYIAAGEERLLAERRRIGNLLPGQVAATPAFGKLAEHGIRTILHAVGPQWKKGDMDDFEITSRIIAQCYSRSLRYPGLQWNSMAFPVISTGAYGFPKEKGLQIAIAEIALFLLESREAKTVYLVAYDENTFLTLKKVFPDIESRIDDTYVAKHWADQYPRADHQPVPGKDPTPVRTDETFADYLDRLIKARNIDDRHKPDDRYYEDSAIYTRANISKQTFSKIRNGKSRPRKENILRLALALRLDLVPMQHLVEKADYKWHPKDALERRYLEARKNGIDNVCYMDDESE